MAGSARRSLMVIAAVAVQGGLLSACELWTGSSRSRASRSDSAGIQLVVSGGSDVPLGWAFREAWRVGGTDDGPESFFRVAPSGIAVDGAGRVHVLDAGNHRVSVWDSSGAFLRSYGREGEGPGEMSRPIALAVHPEGGVSVYDARRGSLVVFRSDGSASDRSTALSSRSRGAISYVGRALAYVAGSYEDNRLHYRLLLEEGPNPTELAAVERAASGMARFESCGVSFNGLPRIFGLTLRWSALDDDIVVSDGAAYGIRWFTAGELRRIVRRDVPVRRATEADALREQGEGMRVRDVLCTAEDVVEELGFAETIPAIASLHLSPDHLWVVRRSVGEEPRRTDVFARDGEYLGTLDDGAPSPTTFLPDGRIVSLEADAMGVQHVVVYEIARGAG